jgi:hypothetical protein
MFYGGYPSFGTQPPIIINVDPALMRGVRDPGNSTIDRDTSSSRGGSCGGDGGGFGRGGFPEDIDLSDLRDVIRAFKVQTSRGIDPRDFADVKPMTRPVDVDPFDFVWRKEMGGCARGLQDLAEVVDNADPVVSEPAQRAADGFCYYALGLLASRCIFPGPGIVEKTRAAGTTRGDGCRDLGREIDRWLGGTRGEGAFEKLGGIADKVRQCIKG